MRNRKRDYFVMGSHCGIVGVVGWCILVAGNNNNPAMHSSTLFSEALFFLRCSF